MDEVNETTLTTGAFTIEDNSTSNNDINVNAGGGGANVARIYWGTKNRSINFDRLIPLQSQMRISPTLVQMEHLLFFWTKVLTRSIHICLVI